MIHFLYIVDKITILKKNYVISLTLAAVPMMILMITATYLLSI